MQRRSAVDDAHLNRKGRVLLALLAGIVGTLVVVPEAPAQVTAEMQPVGPSTLQHALTDAQRDHLWRVGAWGVTNLVGGTLLGALSADETDRFRRGLGWQSAAWGAVNTGISVVGLLTTNDPEAASWAETLKAEQGYAGILLVNLGLNVAYSAVGTTMVVASYRGVSNAETWRGHGTALIGQGVGLFMLDGFAYLGSRTRLEALRSLADQAVLSATPGGVTLTLSF